MADKDGTHARRGAKARRRAIRSNAGCVQARCPACCALSCKLAAHMASCREHERDNCSRMRTIAYELLRDLVCIGCAFHEAEGKVGAPCCMKRFYNTCIGGICHTLCPMAHKREGMERTPRKRLSKSLSHLFLVLLICQKRTPKEKAIRKAFSKSLRFCCKLVPHIAADDEAWLDDGSRDAFICKRCKRLAEACGCNATLCEMLPHPGTCRPQQKAGRQTHPRAPLRQARCRSCALHPQACHSLQRRCPHASWLTSTLETAPDASFWQATMEGQAGASSEMMQ